MAEPRRGPGGGALSGASLAGPDPPDEEDAVPSAHPFAIDEERRYEEVGELGQGGMGQVVSALDRRLRRQVALKRISADIRDRSAAGRRFAREAWITAALDHPAIVPVFDAGVSIDGELYYTMRLIRGRTLDAAVREAEGLRGRLALLRHFLVACEAVAYAHSQGVVHRDLKPDNILIAGFSETQVVDWGVARHLAGEEDRSGPALLPDDPCRTSAGAVIGTPAYMSPEQAAGAPPDPRADVYSLGVVLHEILAGRPLREGGEAPPDAPPELCAVVHRAMQQAPSARYPDARALASDIACYLDGRPVTAHRYSALEDLARWARRRRAPLAVAGAALVLLLTLGAAALVRTRAERDRAVAAERETRGALSAADRALARALVEQALTAQAVDAQPEAEVLAANSLALAESPEARGVLAAFAFAGRPLLRERLDLPRCEVVEPRADGAVLCTSDGDVALYAGRPLVRRWRRALDARGAVWLSGGRLIAVASQDGRGWLLDADGGIRADLRRGQAWHRFSHASDGDLAALVNGQFVSIIDGPRGAAPRITPCPSSGHLIVSVGGRGTRVLAGCRGGAIQLFDREGAPRGRVQTAFQQDGTDPSAAGLSPDGRLLVVTSMTGEVQSYDTATGAPGAGRRTHLGVVRKVAFSPDGTQVALVGDRGGVSIWDPATWALLRRLPADHDQAVVWTEDGREVLTAGARLRRWALPAGQPAIGLMAPRPPGLAGADVSLRGDRLALAAGDGGLVVLDTRRGRRLFADRFQPGVLKGARFLPGDSGLLAWAAGHPSVRRYDAAGRVVVTRDLDLLKRAALLPSGWLLASPYAVGLRIFDLRDPRSGAPPVLAGDRYFLDMDQTADGRRIVAVDEGGGLWWVEDGSPPRARRFAGRPGATSVAVSADGAVVAVMDRRGIEVLDAGTGAPRARCAAGDRVLLDAALSPAGDLVAAGEMDRLARVWSARDGRLLAVLGGHGARVAGVRFSRAAPLLVTASWDGSARVWDLSGLTRPAAALRAETEAAWGLTLAEASVAPLR